ncbi:hypothetical protein [Nocardia asteroides]|uniref:hypothetical protein n=1 Tax=Nocardia asteroides TaxID=1824 RepID=UPI001E3550CA|nr:hypothetical protein [Nocardia asteroides]UGT62487.1 hypothetical protein LTT61_03825 [Nocardia asteroides]
MLGKWPDDIVNYIFNLKREEVQRYCRNCRTVTEQVAVSFSEIPMFRAGEPMRIVGRGIDFLPGITLLGGRPTLCRCGADNR